ncbi:MAG: undecaprenyl-phosphate glucose phosphotransferase [Eubacteriales bacterium]|nr:undecaprenyl-phosphate glucose phosphotransferase [Eubacteriales bacterium]
MIKRWQKTLNSINRLIDLLLLVLSYFAAVYLWLIVIRKTPDNIALTLSHSVWFTLALALFIVLLYQLNGLYDSIRAKPFGHDVKRVLMINAVASIVVAALLFVFRLEEFSRGALSLFYLVSCLFILCKRALIRAILSQYRRQGYNLKHVVLIGEGALAQKFVDTIQKYPRFGFKIDGYIGGAQTIADVPYLGVWEQAGNEELSRPGVDEVVVALDQANLSLLPQILAATEKHGTKVSIIPYFNEYIPSSTTFETLGDCKLLNVRSIPLDSPVNAILKRTMDLLCAAVLILLTSPVMLFAVIGVKLSSPGPVIFRQTRVGKNKKLFQMYKFRSMRVNALENTGWTKNDDPRKTKFGSFIRKTSIDELPQFFNVLKGDMSVVGPRPEIPHFVEQFKETIPLYMLKHLVRPGITGWAQVHGYRGDTSIEGRIQHDIWYIEHWSLGLDIRILFLTAFGGMVNQETVAKQ